MAITARSFSRRDLAMFAACIVLSLVAETLPGTVRDPIAASLRRTIVAPLLGLQYNAELSRRAWLTREQRTQERDSVVLRSMELDGLRGENDRLRALLGLGAQLQWGFIPAEVLHSRAVGEEYAMTLSAGSRAGVRPFSPVVAPEGLVGMVKTVDPGQSIALVTSHPDFRVSAMAADGSALGIVRAHSGAERERYLLEMNGVPVRSTLKPGMLVVSSGFGGTFPRGIPVGTVLSEVKTSELWARTYLLRPSVMPGDMANVMILLPPRSVAGVEGVWARGGGQSLDSATKSVVKAGERLRGAAGVALPDSTVRPPQP
ncbi:MAG: rod shape-determining protein MreC [Gemmatimonadaceae bacterium]